ncbi:MAG: ABC transporter permease [Spirochaetia bacterium]|nr:ABC transporter permease [Spirochaetia bacterium]
MIYKIANRYAFSSKNRHKITSIRIALGLLFSTLALNIVLAFMIGLQDKKFSLIREFDSYDAIIEVNDGIDVNNLISQLKENNNISEAFAFAEVPVIIRNDDGSQLFGKIRAFDENDFNNLPYSIIQGSFSDEGIIMGYTKVLNSSFSYMKPVNITMLKKGKTVTVVPLEIEKEISGVYYSPLKDFNNYYVFMNINLLSKYAPYTPYKIGVFGDIDSITSIVGDRGKVESWIDQNLSLYAAMKLEQLLMYLTLSIMSIIVLINLYGSTINLIKSKKSEIAMLRALGITKKQTKNIFTLSSLIVSCTGIIMGSILSFLSIHYYSVITSFLNKITNYMIPILSVDVNLNFSIKNSLLVALPLFILTIFISKIAVNKLLKNDSMEILLNE